MNEHKLSERARVSYLEAMGLDTYVPRWVLPNARKSTLCELGSDAEIVSEAPPMTKSLSDPEAFQNEPKLHGDTAEPKPSSTPIHSLTSVQAKSINAGLSDVLAELSGETPGRGFEKSDSPETKTNEPVQQGDPGHTSSLSARAIQEQLEPARFNLGLWFTDSNLQVLDSRQEGDALPTEALLSNILLANGLIQSPLPSMETQTWPFPGSSELEQGWDAACQMMSDFFEFRFAKSPALAILAFGEDAAKVTMDPQFDYQTSLFRKVSSQHNDIEVVVLPALREFLYEPALKSRLWGALTELRKGVAN